MNSTHTSFLAALPGLLLAALLAFAATAGTARAAMDPLCGATITEDLTFTADVDCTLFKGTAITIGASNVTIDGAGFRLLTPDATNAIASVGHSNVSIRNVELIGWCTGTGITITGGSGHTISNVDASGRITGVAFTNTANISITNLSVDAATNALDLRNVALPIALSGLALSNNATGLRLQDITGPLTIDAAAIPNLLGNDWGVNVVGNVHHVTFDGLVIDADLFGIHAYATTNSNLTFRNLDVTGRVGIGTGLRLYGNNHRVENVVASRRAIGVQGNTVDNLTLFDITVASATTAAIELTTVTGTLPLRNLSLTDSTIGFFLSGYNAPTGYTVGAFDPATNSGAITSLDNSNTGLDIRNVQNATFRDFSANGISQGILANWSTNARLSFVNLDLSSTFNSGNGLFLAGSEHNVVGVTARRRVYGFRFEAPSALTATDLFASGGTAGIYFRGLSAAITAPTFLRLTLPDNTVGLHLENLTAPLTLTPANQIDTRTSLTGISITASTVVSAANTTLRDLVLDNRTAGVSAAGSNHRFERLNLSGPAAGTGLSLSGNGHVVTDVIANGRGVGFNVNATATAITNITANQCSQGLNLFGFGVGTTLPTLQGLNLRANTIALNISGITASLLIDAATNLDVAESLTAISIGNSSNLTFSNLLLPAIRVGVLTTGTIANLTFTNVDVSGPAPDISANGMTLNGPNHVLTNVTANFRAEGVRVTNGSGLRITNLQATNNMYSGLHLVTLAATDTAPVLSGLDLRNNGTGLAFSSVLTPLTINATTGLDVDGSREGIYLASSADITFSNLVIRDADRFGINAYILNQRLTFQDLDLRGFGTGTGLQLGWASNAVGSYGGNQHTVTRVDVSHRDIGLRAIATSALTVHGLTATHCNTGFLFEPYPNPPAAFTPPTLRQLDLRHNGVGLNMIRVHGTLANPFVINAWDPATQTGTIVSLDGSMTAIALGETSHIQVTGLHFAPQPWNTGARGIVVNNATHMTFRDLTLPHGEHGLYAEFNNSNFLIEDVDVSGQGLGIGLRLGVQSDRASNPVPYYGGPNHIIRNVTANRRATGVMALAASNLLVDGLTATNNTTHGLQIEGHTVTSGFIPPLLSGLVLDDNAIGVRLHNFGGTLTTPWRLGPDHIVSISGCDTSISANLMRDVRVHDLTLDGRLNGYSGNGERHHLVDLNVSGTGQGTGLGITGTDHIVERIAARDRSTGVIANTTTNATLRDIEATRCNWGVQVWSTTLPLTLQRLTLPHNAIALRFATVTGTGSVPVNAWHPTNQPNGTLVAWQGSPTVVTTSLSPQVTVDTAGLGLTQSGANFNQTLASTPPCGQTITTSLTLTEDLDCSGVTGNAITVGASDITINGNGFRIIAPQAGNAIRLQNQDRVTIRDIDVSGFWTGGTGVSVSGGVGHRLLNVQANRRATGVDIGSTGDVGLTNVTANDASSIGVSFSTVAMPISLAGLVVMRSAISGVRFNNIDGLDPDTGLPWAIDGTALNALDANQTSITLTTSVRNIRFVGPIAGLDGQVAAITGTGTGHTGLAFEGLTFPAPRWFGGTAVSLHGPNHRLDGISVAGRQTGVIVTDSEGLIARDIAIEQVSGDALRFDGGQPLLLQKISLRYSQNGLVLRNRPDPGVPLVIDAWDPATGLGAMVDMEGTRQGIWMANVNNVRTEGLVLNTYQYGIYADEGTNSKLTFANLDVSGTRRVGFGIQVRGSELAFSNVRVADRAFGLYVNAGVDLQMHGIEATRIVTEGIYIGDRSGLFSFRNLDIDGVATGLRFATLTATQASPIVLDAWNPATGLGAIARIERTSTSIQAHGVHHLIARNLILGGDSVGFNAWNATNSHHRYENIDVSHRLGLGTGLQAAGPHLTISGVTAHRRNTGVQVGFAPAFHVEGVVASGAAVAALSIQDVSMAPTPFTLKDLTLNRSARGLQLSNITGTLAQPVVIDPWNPATGTGVMRDIGLNATSIHVTGSEHVHFRNLATDGWDFGISVDVGTPRNFRFENVDVTPRQIGGRGIQLRGFDHTLSQVVARMRSHGIYANAIGGTRFENVAATHNSYGLTMASTANTPLTFATPTFLNVDLRDNWRGLDVLSWQLPMVLDGDDGWQFDGSLTAMGLSGSANITVRDLVMRNNLTASVTATTASTNLRFENVDVSGEGLGDGMYFASQTGLQLVDVTANGRASGVRVDSAASMQLENLSLRNNTSGLYLVNFTPAHNHPVVAGVDVRGSNMGLRLQGISRPMTIGASWGLDVAGSWVGVSVVSSAGLVFEDLDLRGTATGFSASSATSQLTVRRTNASGTGRGTGVYILGAGAVVQDVTVAGRVTCLQIDTADGAVIENTTLSGCSDNGLRLGTIQPPAVAPTLTNVQVSGSNYGLRIENSTTPTTYDGSQISLLGNIAPILVGTESHDLTFRNFVLPSSGIAIQADNGWNRRITIENTDVTGYCRATGIRLGGVDNVISDVVIARRAIGLQPQWGHRLQVRDTVIGGNTTGLSFAGDVAEANTTVVANAQNTTSRFHVASINWIRAGTVLDIALGTGTVQRTVTAVSSTLVTFSPALAVVAPTGTVVRSEGFATASPRMTLVDSDVCANGTGVTAVANDLRANGNYWRASSGPLHTALNPGGTGDTVTGTNLTLDTWNAVPTDKENHYCNQAPVPVAGPDQEVCEGDVVTLDASASNDPDIEPLTFVWTQREGTEAAIEPIDSAIATFVAPTPAGGADDDLLVFRVRVDDGHLWRTDDVAVRVLKGNTLPVAVPGGPLAIAEGDAVTIDGSASFDPEGQILTYLWEQVSGPPGTLAGADTATPLFTAGLLDVGGETVSEVVVLRLTVTDEALPEHCGGPRSHSATMTVTVANVNTDPVADAGADFAAADNTPVTLNAMGSFDADGDVLAYAWEQLGGAAVTLVGANTVSPSFTTPLQPAPGTEVLVFRVTVSDGFGGSDVAVVTVTVMTDACPDDPDKLEPGACGCGVPDTDGDGDDVADCVDGCATDPDKVAPGLCGCGISEVDGDGDGVPDCADGCPADGAKTEPGACGCGAVDTDSDGDGAADCVDACPADANKVEAGDCGCNIADIDTDGDGVADCIDGCPSDGAKTEPGQCGCGVPDTDTLGTGTADCLSDCNGLPDGTIVAVDVPCGDGMCGNATGTEYCEGGLLLTTCDDAWEQIPDVTCGVGVPVVAYAIAYRPDGEPAGTIRCLQAPDGVITCDTRPGEPTVLLVYPGLYCPGVAP